MSHLSIAPVTPVNGLVSQPKKERVKRSIKDLLDSFESERPRMKVFGSFRIQMSKLTHWNETEQKLTVVAVKIGGLIVGNASILKYVGCHAAWGSYQYNRTQTDVQRKMQERGWAMLPFNVFEEAKLDVSGLSLVEKAKSETVKVETEIFNPHGKNKVKIETRHFVGASVFKIGKQYFLFDIDRNEIVHRIFNPFLVKLPKAVKSIEQAYKSLKPIEVLRAEKKRIKVKRQGEWFLIPCKAPKVKPNNDLMLLASITSGLDKWAVERLSKEQRAAVERCKSLGQSVARPQNLQAGVNRPNEAELVMQVGKTVYVKGLVKHTGREHKDLNLSTWHIAVPNTAVSSWTITGDID